MIERLKQARGYRSPLRDAQSAQTRERILAAAKEFLESGDLEDLTLRRLAELAEVSAPTVYAHFPTMDDLERAFFEWLRPHLGTDAALPPLAEISAMPQHMFQRYARHGRLLRNLMNTPAWDRLRRDDWRNKQDSWSAVVRSAHPHLMPAELARAAIALAAFSTPNMWRWLIDITGCSQAEAERIATWATAALADAIGSEAPSPARATSPRRKGRPS
jgi:AcrR family transcriptional regulator